MYVAPVIRIHSLHLTKHKKKEAFFLQLQYVIWIMKQFFSFFSDSVCDIYWYGY